MDKNYTGKEFLNKAKGLVSPTQLPENEKTRIQWQSDNKMWWELTPMRYDWNEKLPFEIGSREYFNEIDRRFYKSVKQYMPWSKKPFDNLINFKELEDMDILEIGVGQGTHAELLAPFCKSYTGIDITESASSLTQHRLKISGIQGKIFQMDAEKMSFPDSSFDYIWSWGVIHHSSDTFQILKEMHRVLRPNGLATVMIYHRSFWKYYIIDGIFKRIYLKKYSSSFTEMSQLSTDGALARFYRTDEWKNLCKELFEIDEIMITGQKTDIIPMPPCNFKNKIIKLIPNALTRYLSNQLKMGTFLIVKMQRI
jgi:ubiquinone/menaquinone biosynthesis C-methylase UbiE